MRMDGRTDRQTDMDITKLIVVLPHFAKAPRATMEGLLGWSHLEQNCLLKHVTGKDRSVFFKVRRPSCVFHDQYM
jgi:hypothetical protein